MNLKSSLICCFILLCSVSGYAQSYNNTISGFIYDAQTRQPVSQIYVEVQNELGQVLKRLRIESGGRYYFTGLSSGNFRISVLPLGTNFLQQTQEAVITNFSRGSSSTSSDNVYLDFYLKIDSRKVDTGVTGTVPGAIFVEEVPTEARKLYTKAAEQLADKKDTGLDDLKQAIQIAPSYYAALDLLGTEYVKRSQFKEAIPYLIKAVEVNGRSFSSSYALGVAQLNLKQNKEAVAALKSATEIYPQSPNAQLRYGTALRISGDNENAEKTLLKAKELLKKTPIAEVHWQLALLYNKIEKYQKAADELELFLKVQPDSTNAEQIKKLIAQLRDKPDKA